MTWGRAVARRADVALLIALAYVPALAAAPGRMPADSKLFLYLDPGRLLSDARWSWDTRQFAGWVPHQAIAYLWPSGPWFWFWERIGVPDWIAHRLWIGSLLVAAGLGARWAARHLGLGVGGALVAGIVYQATPYIVPYVSRTSVMLLPWAGLGWLVGLTIRTATNRPWRHAALFALVVATVGAVNATAIALVAPAPLLWLVHAAAGRQITWRRAAATAARLAGLSLAVSLWWIAMLAVQARHGADVLAYSETLEAVSFTSNAVEAARGLGYWLFYVRDPLGFATTASEHFMRSPIAVAISFALLLAGLCGLALVRWRDRRFAALLVGVGIVLAVGVHPIDDPSPLMTPAAEASRSTLALALRSSTRALPLAVLGLALASGALADAAAAAFATARAGRWRGHRRHLAAVAIGALAIVNLPILWTGGIVDPHLDRDADPPAAWRAAAAELDAGSSGYRVLQLPGAEFGGFRWGDTVDPPLPGMTTKPLVTRDLLPLGSPAAMDLLDALDDRFQQGIVEPDAIAPVARLLGADTIWVPGDIAHERFRLPRPEQTDALFAAQPEGLGAPIAFGEPEANPPPARFVDDAAYADARIGSPVPPVSLVPVEDPQPIVRAKAATVVLAGSGDGVVDAAAAGLIDGSEAIVYAAALHPTELDAQLDRAALVIVTDSNRDRAHHWRSSQDVTGFTETGGEGAGVAAFDDGDQRLPVFPEHAADNQTVAEQRGPVAAVASGYGEPFAYRPEDRAAMAIDGDPATAWTVADRADPIGAFIELRSAEPAAAITVIQPSDPDANRWITEVELTVDGAPSGRVVLDETSRSPTGQTISLPQAGATIRLTIAAVAGRDRPSAPGPDGVGFAELRVAGADGAQPASTEVVRLPQDALRGLSAEDPLAIVLTRLRVDPADRWRDDPERSLSRAFTLPQARDVELDVDVRLSRRAGDAVIAPLLGLPTTADRRLGGAPGAGGWAATDGDLSTAWHTPVAAAPRAALSVPIDASSPTTTLTIRQRAGDDHSVATQLRLSAGEATREVSVPPPDADGVSVVSFEPLQGETLTLEIVDAEMRTALDRRTGERVALPLGIVEIAGPTVATAPLPDAFDLGCRDDLLRIDGQPVPIAISGSVAAAFAGEPLDAQLCDPSAMTLDAGEHLVTTAPGMSSGIDVDRVVLRAGEPRPAAPAVTATIVSSSRTGRTVRVGPCPDGCWLVFGEGHNDGWSARGPDGPLGDQTLVDGGFNGWWMPPSSGERIVTLRWTPQRTVDVALLLSLTAAIACLAVAIAGRGRSSERAWSPNPERLCWARPARVTWQASIGAWAAATVAAAVCISPAWGAAALVVGAIACGALRRPALLGWSGLAIVVAVAGRVLMRMQRYDYPADPLWPRAFDDLHRPMLLAVVFVVVGGSAGAPRRSEAAGRDDEDRGLLAEGAHALDHVAQA